MKKIILTLFIVSICVSQNIIPLKQKLQMVDGKIVTLSELQNGKPILVSFWALWCGPCKSELKALQKLSDSILIKGGIVVAVNIDNPKSLSKVRAYVESQKYSIPILLDPNSKLFEMLNGQNLPHSVLFDTNGEIVSIKNTYIPGDEKFMYDEIVQLIEKK